MLYRYLNKGECRYYNQVSKEFNVINNSYAMIVLTAINNKNKLSKCIVDSVDYVIELEPYTVEQQKLIVHQILTLFCDINYIGGEVVLQDIVDQGAGMISLSLDFLKECIIVMRAEMLDSLDMEVVNKAKRIWDAAPIGPPPIPNDIPL